MKTIPFNIEKARAGKPVQTVGGNKARIVCFDLKDPDSEYSLLVILEDDDGFEREYDAYTMDGKYDINSEEQEEMDLVMAPETKSTFIHIYLLDNGSLWICDAHSMSLEEAKKSADSDGINKYIETREIIVEI
jgi:hypothetical protein